jgi:hypothetical protein
MPKFLLSNKNGHPFKNKMVEAKRKENETIRTAVRCGQSDSEKLDQKFDQKSEPREFDQKYKLFMS